LTQYIEIDNTQRLQRAVDREAQRIAPRHLVDALSTIGPIQPAVRAMRMQIKVSKIGGRDS
jgi:hypothetical protein